MSDQDLEKIFKQAEVPPPNAAAKRRAINLAMAEFTQAQSREGKSQEEKTSNFFQGFLKPLRLIGKSNNSDGSKDMNKKTMPWFYGSIAGVSMVLFAGFLVIRVPSDFNTPETIDVKVMPEVAEEEIADVQAPQPSLLKEVPVGTLSAESVASGHSVGQDSALAALSDDAGRASGIATAPVIEEKLQHATQAKKLKAATLSSARTRKLEGVAYPAAMPPARDQRHIQQDISVPNYYQEEGRERFEAEKINSVKRVSDEPVSTFSVDVDTASYAFVRRKLNQGVMPTPDAVRIEEFVNYFDYKYPTTRDKKTPFATHVLVGDAPWKKGNKLLHIGIKGYEITEQPKSNLVFLLDVSGSMNSPDKLPLVKQSIQLLLTKLQANDKVSIVVYAGAAGTVLEPTSIKDKNKILNALNQLQAGGSTAGGQGIELAYKLAEQNFDKDAVNRIILATDGDFNVGVSDPDALKKLVEKKRESGVFLSVLGFGQGNYHDALTQALAQNGNGVAAYIDTLSEAQKVLVEESTSSLFTIAKDVKIQVDFNPETVAEYRLIGYETRHLNREDFNNDKVDAGDIGAGHTVTAIYEITPVESNSHLIDESRYSDASTEKDVTKKETSHKNKNEYAFLKLRYKLPNEDKSTLITKIIPTENTIGSSSKAWEREAFDFSSSVAGFAQLLKDDRYMNDWTYDHAIEQALKSRGGDAYGYRNEFVQLIRKAKLIDKL